jgi:iron complex outermembrane receptor protein
MFLILSLSLAIQDSATDLGTTVVTARKIEEAIEDVPASVSALSSDDITKSGMRSISDAVGRIPNLHFTEFSARRLSFPYVRGIGSGLGEPSVATYVDGVPQLSVGSTNLPLLGMERIEFLRGPQGTLYGRNAMGGVIHMVGRQPGGQTDIGGSAMYGNHALREVSSFYSGPLGDDAGFVFDGRVSRRDGYTTNDFTGDLVDDRKAISGRTQLALDLSDSSSLSFSLTGQKAEDGGFGLGELGALRDNPHRINQDFEGETARNSFQPSIVYAWADGGQSFTSISAFTTMDLTETSDFDFSSIDGVRRRTEEKQDVLYQELRWSDQGDFDVDKGEGVRLLVGLSAFDSEATRSAANEFRPGMFPPAMQGLDTNTGDFVDRGVGLFGQLGLSPAPGWELTYGVRMDRESKKLDANHTFETGGITVPISNASFEDAFGATTPMLSASYRPTDSSQVYAYAAKAFKAGGFNLAAPAGEQFFDPESSWTYEVGYKRSLTEKGLDLRVAVFSVDWQDMQMSLFDPVVGGYVDNAGESTSKGVEVELDADLGDGWGMFAGLGIARTEFQEFTDAFGQDVAGNSLANAPEQTWSVGMSYDRELAEGGLFARAGYVGVQDLFYDPGNLESEDYELVNLSGGYQSGDWRIAVFVRNALDEAYVPVAFQANPADPTYFIGENGAPRNWGVSIGISF